LWGSRQTIAMVVAHREPWGVEKSTTSKGLSIIQKLQQKKFQRIRFLYFKFNPQIYIFFNEKLVTFLNYFCNFLKVLQKFKNIF
jgi:hypothetical protein